MTGPAPTKLEDGNETGVLRIPAVLYERMRAHAARAYPAECCGALLGNEDGTSKTVLVLEELENQSETEPGTRYQIAAEDLIRLQKSARELGQEIVGFYHSHPDCAALWSQTDLREAHWTGCSYVITSVQQGQAQETRSFALRQEDEKRFDEEAVQVFVDAEA